EAGVEFVSLDELFRTSSVVSVHLAHTGETEGLVDRRLIELLPEDAIFVNTARGALVDHAALADRLRRGTLRVVGLDVFSPEPPPASEPLLRAENVVWSP